MNRSIKKLGITAAAALLFAAFATTPALAQEEITLWLNGDKARDGMKKIGEKFTADTGIKVNVQTPPDASGKFQTQAASGKGPDVIQWAHDMAGQWVTAGLLHPVKPNAKIRRALLKKGWQSVTIGGQVYGYPLAFEAVGMICNKKLVPTAPRNFEDFFKLHKKLAKNGKRSILWDYNNTYFTMGLLHAGGGYSFKAKNDGSYNNSDVGVNKPGAIKGLALIVKLITDGVMPKGAKYSDMESSFVKGELGCMITGPWAWDNLRKNNISFSVSALPRVAGKPAKPFVGVQAFMINKASKNKQAAIKFIEEYVLTPQGLKMLDQDKPLGVPAHTGFYRQLAKNPYIRATMANVKAGILMPNSSKMGAFWSSMASALENATNGRQSPKDALDGAYKRITSN